MTRRWQLIQHSAESRHRVMKTSCRKPLQLLHLEAQACGTVLADLVRAAVNVLYIITMHKVQDMQVAGEEMVGEEEVVMADEEVLEEPKADRFRSRMMTVTQMTLTNHPI